MSTMQKMQFLRHFGKVYTFDHNRLNFCHKGRKIEENGEKRIQIAQTCRKREKNGVFISGRETEQIFAENHHTYTRRNLEKS